MRSKILAANWKMNKKASDIEGFFDDFFGRLAHLNLHKVDSLELLFAVPSPLIETARRVVEGKPVGIAAQTLSEHESGAFTGEISASMLADLGVRDTLIGHSERRQYFAETNNQVADKAERSLMHGIRPIVCVGETLENRKNNEMQTIIAEQLDSLFKKLAEWESVVVAYEPVWAIGTGVTASAGEAQEVHSFIRGQIASRYGVHAANRAPIIYGGSVKPSNISELLQQKDIDGALVGGASLSPVDFASLVTNAIG